MNDRELGMKRRISRRDFLNGVLWTAGTAFLSPAVLLSSQEPYPPALTGMRGSNDGSFEVAHRLRDGVLWQEMGNPVDTGEKYDLVVVGAGISGLASAWYFRKATGPKTKILILDNHDDFGGHARRQEFKVGGRLLITYGGTYAIESPSPYSKIADQLIRELGIDVASWSKVSQPDPYQKLGLKQKWFFRNHLLPDPFEQEEEWESFLKQVPFSEKAKADLVRLYHYPMDYWPGLSSREKKARLARMSYADFLTKVAQCDLSILPFFQARTHDLYGVGVEAVPAQDAWGLGYPGFTGMKLDPEPGVGMNYDAIRDEKAEEYFFHFPDGNATIARLLVGKLIPSALPGKSVEDIVLATARYSKLDETGAPTRLRLSSTVVRVQHSPHLASAKEVEIAYVQNGKLLTVRASRCVLACWHSMIPYICPELPTEQKEALAYAIKVPLIRAKVAVRNWKPWAELKTRRIYAPENYYSFVYLSHFLNTGGYQTSREPDGPVVVSLDRAPCSPGYPARQQHRFGRVEILTTGFQDYEREIRKQMASILGPAGFDPARDITAISLFRWPHGYAYQYNSLDDPFWREGKEGPCVRARKPFGRITIANADAAAYSYTDAAIDQAYRAIQEIFTGNSKPNG